MRATVPRGAPPEGFVYAGGILTAEEETTLLAELDGLRFDPIVLHGRPARRMARHYGLDYDYRARTPGPGEPIPEWLSWPRARAAAFADVEPEQLVEILVQRYPAGSTMGWHRDAPAFDIVVGLSLGAAARLRFQRGKGELREVWERVLEPRSGYVLAGPARWSWQHSIPPAKERRYSITFRTLRTPSATGGSVSAVR